MCSLEISKYTPILDLGNHFGWPLLSCGLSFKIHTGYPNGWEVLKWFFLSFYRLSPLNISSGALYVRSNLGLLLHWSITWRNTNVYNSIWMDDGHRVCALSKTALAFSTMDMIYLSAIPFWWCAPTPQYVKCWSLVRSSALRSTAL